MPMIGRCPYYRDVSRKRFGGRRRYLGMFLDASPLLAIVDYDRREIYVKKNRHVCCLFIFPEVAVHHNEE